MTDPPGQVGADLVERAARIAGLNELEPPTLEAVERRRLQLWVLTLLLLATVAGGLVVLAFMPEPHLPSWLDPSVVEYGLLGLVGLFCAYAIEKELQLRRLTQLLVAEKVLTAALTNRLLELASLLEAGKAINLGLDLDEVLETILHCAMELLHGRDGSIMLSSGGRELRTVSTAGRSAAQGARVRFGEGVAGRVAATGEPLLISGEIGHDPADRRLDAPSPTSAMSVPLVHRDDLLGVLNLNAGDEREYTEHDLRALSLFGEQAASAIANSQLYQAQRLIASQKLFQALHDSLTRLPNRALFLERVSRALARHRGEEDRVALLFLDLDDFKRINDSLGHAAGDEVLIAFAERMRGSVRATDTVARFGGDEFAILVEDIRDTAEAVAAAERLLAVLVRPFPVGDREVSLTGSVGVAIEAPGATTQEDLLRHADTALHAAKEKGKGLVLIFEHSMHTRALKQLDVESELRRALAQGELAVHFQPIYDLQALAATGFEALVRWHHPERGLLPASAFVPFAEHAGILAEIDRWVLHEACRVADALGNRGPGGRPLQVNVNLSPSRLHHPRIVDEVSTTLSSSGLNPELLTLEITESAVLDDSDSVGHILRRLKRLGVRLALDDFGTGYSSLSYVRSFPVDAVKIDRVFVDGLARDAGTTALVQAIVKLGHGLSLEVIAEGIERRAQVDALLEIECTRGQGWLLSRSVPETELVGRLDERNPPASGS